MQITTIGLDLAKNVFQLHAVDATDDIVLRKRLRRAQVLAFFAALPRCVVGLEACGSAHFWARELIALGHEVRIIPPSYVKPYVRRGKNDAADGEAICEAVLLDGAPRTANASILEAAQMLLLRKAAFDAVLATDPGLAQHLIVLLCDRRKLEGEIRIWHRENEASRRLATIPGLGEITASAIAATVPDASFFRSGREFAAWLGLTPRQNSTGGKERLGRTTKQGNRHIRSLLVIGATSLLRYWRGKAGAEAAWMNRLLERRPPRLVTVALANKLARIVWAVLARGETYRRPCAATA